MEPTSLTSIPSSAAGRPAPKLEDEPLVARDRQLGWALVGLGKLTLGGLLPAFAETRFCKLTALVSGNPGKARQVAAQQGLELDAIYDYSGFDRIALDQRVERRLHRPAERAARRLHNSRFARRQARPVRKADGDHGRAMRGAMIGGGRGGLLHSGR